MNRFRKNGADKKYTWTNYSSSQRGDGDLGCPSKIVEELLTVILCDKVLKWRQSSLSREVADVLFWSLKFLGWSPLHDFMTTNREVMKWKCSLRFSAANPRFLDGMVTCWNDSIGKHLEILVCLLTWLEVGILANQMLVDLESQHIR